MSRRRKRAERASRGELRPGTGHVPGIFSFGPLGRPPLLVMLSDGPVVHMALTASGYLADRAELERAAVAVLEWHGKREPLDSLPAGWLLERPCGGCFAAMWDHALAESGAAPLPADVWAEAAAAWDAASALHGVSTHVAH